MVLALDTGGVVWYGDREKGLSTNCSSPFFLGKAQSSRQRSLFTAGGSGPQECPEPSPQTEACGLYCKGRATAQTLGAGQSERIRAASASSSGPYRPGFSSRPPEKTPGARGWWESPGGPDLLLRPSEHF